MYYQEGAESWIQWLTFQATTVWRIKVHILIPLHHIKVQRKGFFVAKDGILLQSESMKSAWLHHKGLHQHSKESPQKRHALCVSPMHVTHSVVVQYVLCVSLCLIIATILVLVFPSYWWIFSIQMIASNKQKRPISEYISRPTNLLASLYSLQYI